MKYSIQLFSNTTNAPNYAEPMQRSAYETQSMPVMLVMLSHRLDSLALTPNELPDALTNQLIRQMPIVSPRQPKPRFASHTGLTASHASNQIWGIGVQPKP